ncbi:MAG TPA: alkaline phosphatase family protein [Acidimicrobiales bacterium]|nr:alkaline phosphatase family protein [Acidimicrobiales bacterium]
MSSPTKILALGLDSFDPDLMWSLAAEGGLPNIESLFARGAWQATVNPPGLFVGAVWPSFYTGASPATHGRYCFRQLVPGTYDVEAFLPSALRARPFWSVLSEAGRRVAVVDVPHSAITPDLEGVQVAEWGAHDSDLDFATWPPRLAADVEKRYGMHPVPGHCNAARSSVTDFAIFREQLLDGVEVRTRLLCDLLDRGGWDLFLAVLSESHCAGHQCWHLHDPGHPLHDAEQVSMLGDPIADVYRALDRAVGRLVSRVDDDTTVMLLLSHGMGPRYEATAMLDEVLVRLETVAMPEGRRRLTAALRWGWQRTPPTVRGLLKRTVDGSRPPAMAVGVSRGEAARRSFAVPNNDTCGAIRVNLAGREPSGRVAEEELDDYLTSLSSELLALRNGATGRPVVASVTRTADVYGGRIDHLPDLLVDWCWDDAAIESICSPGVGTVRRPRRGPSSPVNDFRTGDHRPSGAVAIAAPWLSPGRLPDPLAVTDLAPTICALLGVDLPGVDGRPVHVLTAT